MSQKALALAAGVAPATIGQAELGRQTPRLLSMRRICNALDVEPEDVTEFAAAMANAMTEASPLRMGNKYKQEEEGTS